MKVLIAIPCLLTGGTEIQTLNLVRALIQGGHQVTTACYFEHTEIWWSCMKMRVVKWYSFKEGVRLGGVKGILFLLKNLWKIKLSFKPDVVHVQYMAPGAIPIILLNWWGRKYRCDSSYQCWCIWSKSNETVKVFAESCIESFYLYYTKSRENFFGSCSLFDSSICRIPAHAHYTIYNALPGYIQITDKKEKIRIL